MTPEQKKAADYAEILMAFSRGEELQVLSGPNAEPDSQRWSTISYPAWDFAGCKYRIAPKPVERWVRIHDDGSVCVHNVHDTKEGAATVAKVCGGRVALMREVTE